MRLVPRLPRRSRSHVLHLGRLLCRRLGLCEWRQAQTHERHTCGLMGGVHSGMEPGECGDTRGRASLWKQCRAGAAVFSNLWFTPPRQVVDRCRSALGPMLRCRRDAQLMLLELGEGHGVEHLVGRRGHAHGGGSRCGQAGLRGAARMYAPARCPRAPWCPRAPSVSAAAWSHPSARREAARATWRGVRRWTSRSASLR